jgi:hypothetical protein
LNGSPCYAGAGQVRASINSSRSNTAFVPNRPSRTKSLMTNQVSTLLYPCNLFGKTPPALHHPYDPIYTISDDVYVVLLRCEFLLVPLSHLTSIHSAITPPPFCGFIYFQNIGYCMTLERDQDKDIKTWCVR